MCKARLGLARVSVVRGEGPALGTPAIDDHIRSLEPITDYLTKWSGLVSLTPPSLLLTTRHVNRPMQCNNKHGVVIDTTSLHSSVASFLGLLL